jgi:hypothetical protein
LQSVLDRDEPSRNHRALPHNQPLRRQLAANAGFPDYPAPVVRNAGAEGEIVMMRWGTPTPRAYVHDAANRRQDDKRILAKILPA